MMRASVFRLSPLLLLAAALVALAVFFAPGGQPAQAQSTTVWSATLTVQDIIGLLKGCQENEANDCSAALTDDSFTYAGVSYQVIRVFVQNSDGELVLSLDKVFMGNVRPLDGLALNVGGVGGQSFPLASAASGARSNDGDQAKWANSGLSWSVGDTVEVSLKVPTPTVSLSASPNPVREGSSVTVTATISPTRSSATVVPLTLHAGTAESGDYGNLASITIPANMASATGVITTTADSDTDDEVFQVAVSNVSADAGYTRDDTSWVDITILDGGLRRVSLTVGPNPVPEGDDVTVVATLSTASPGEPGSLGRNVTIPITLTAGTAESGDYGALSSITITAGDFTGEATISTTDDTDADDETFTVALGDLTTVRGVTTGPITSVQVRITDGDAASPGTLSVDTGWGNPACGSTISVISETPESALVLRPAPAAEVQTEYRVLADSIGNWLASVPIRTTGSSVFTSTTTYGGLLEAYPGFRGFEYRLADHANVSVSCTWSFQTGGV